ncbi:MAG: hypothetical protein H8D74_02530 [Chloroflexi bacterium]|nr:hypothetical protein [Chloroflexota bacterium]
MVLAVAGQVPSADSGQDLAARRVGAGTIRAWTCFYVPFEGANRRTCYRLARMSDTEMGRRLAYLLGRE